MPVMNAAPATGVIWILLMPLVQKSEGPVILQRIEPTTSIHSPSAKSGHTGIVLPARVFHALDVCRVFPCRSWMKGVR
jgi:hypothetical protein